MGISLVLSWWFLLNWDRIGGYCRWLYFLAVYSRWWFFCWGIDVSHCPSARAWKMVKNVKYPLLRTFVFNAILGYFFAFKFSFIYRYKKAKYPDSIKSSDNCLMRSLDRMIKCSDFFMRFLDRCYASLKFSTPCWKVLLKTPPHPPQHPTTPFLKMHKKHHQNLCNIPYWLPL